MINTKETTEGRRIEAVFYDGGQLDTVRRYWYNDQWQTLTQEMWLTGQPYSVQRNYIYGNYIDEVLGFEWVFAEIPWGWFYYLHDHLYSPVALLDEWNGILERYEYDAYGRREVMTAWFTPLPNGIGEHGLTGRELDELDFGASGSLCIIYYGDRYYACDLGRWISMYIGNESGRGVNPYWYALMMNHYDDLLASAKSNLLTILGETSCDTSSGKPAIKNYNQGATRQCTQDHEERHAKQIGSCCDKYASKRRTSSKTQQAKDDKAWGDWISNNRKVFECIAYKDSLRCGLNLQRQGCWTKDQSDEIDNYIKNARNQMDNNCTGNGGSYTACPF